MAAVGWSGNVGWPGAWLALTCVVGVFVASCLRVVDFVPPAVRWLPTVVAAVAVVLGVASFASPPAAAALGRGQVLTSVAVAVQLRWP